MLLVELNNVEKYFGERRLFKIEDLKIYQKDRIGIVGLNGCGKTTLLKIMMGRIEPEAGKVKLFSTYAYISQFADCCDSRPDPWLARKFEDGMLKFSSPGGEI